VTRQAALAETDDGLRTALFSAPMLRVLDARSRADVWLSGTLHHKNPGETLFLAGAPADSLFVVGRGSVSVEGATDPALATGGAVFGWDAVVPGASRSGRALMRDAGVVLELPLATLRRALARSGASEHLLREERAVRERAWARLLRATELGAVLDETELARLRAASREETRALGGTLAAEGDRANEAWLVASGLVEMRSAGDGRAAFASRGDFIGLEPLLAGGRHPGTLKALGDVVVLSVPGRALDSLAHRHPAAVERERARERGRIERQRRVALALDPRATRHALDHAGRLERASSLLAIELEACVRCGHCARACADTHGTARLSRRGDKLSVVLAAESGPVQRALLLPTACQHCRDPACLSECPTSAIVGAANGAVLIKSELCTGCGACVTACPYDAIELSERATGQGGTGAMVAEKCDLCAGSSGPECVAACPTGAIFRADPARDFAEMRVLLGVRSVPVDGAPKARGVGRYLVRAALVPPLLAAVALSGQASAPLRLIAGIVAGVLTLGLAAHSALKRVSSLRALVRRFLGPLGVGRGLLPVVQVHAGTGVLAASAVLLHAGFAIPSGVAGALALGFWLLSLSGIAGALLYALLPPRLSRLTRVGALPEDRAAERAELDRALYTALSGKNDAVQALARSVLLPYGRAPLGPLALLFSGRSRADEAAALRARIATILDGRASARLAGAEPALEASVALRALAAERFGEALLRAFVPLHALLAVFVVVLLALHVLGAVR